MRNVKVFKYQKTEGKSGFGKVFDCTAEFHEFGVDYEEFDSGAGNFSTAIVELPDGTIKNVPVELVQFEKEAF